MLGDKDLLCATDTKDFAQLEFQTDNDGRMRLCRFCDHVLAAM